MAEIKPKKGGNKISKTQKAGTTKKTLFEKENETPSRNASYTPVVGFFFSIILVQFVHILHIYHLTVFFYYYLCKGEVNKVLHTPLWSLSRKTRTPQIEVWGQPKLFALIIHRKRLYQPDSLFNNSFILLQSFRICTPPSPEMKGSWKKNILKLDPKSDNSESSDILVNCIYCHSIRILLVLCYIQIPLCSAYLFVVNSSKSLGLCFLILS